MFKLLSPLVKDQTDQPSEPVSLFCFVFFFLGRIALFSCVYTYKLLYIIITYFLHVV